MKCRTAARSLVGIAGFLALIGFLAYSDSMLREVIFDQCPVDVRWEYAVPGDGRYSITYYQRDCSIIPYEEGVFAEKSRFPWPWPEREYIFLFPREAYHMNIIPTGPNSVAISAEQVDAVFSAETSWGTLKIDYNIGKIYNPRPNDPVTTGAAWSERQNALVEQARSQGIRTSIKVIPPK
jgi:hypothetical protein